MRRPDTLFAALWVVLVFTGMGCSESKDAEPDRPEEATPVGSAGSAAMAALPDRTAGSACGSNSDCANGTCLTSLAGSFGGAPLEAPGGYCSATCLTDVDCGEGGVCAGAIPGFGGGGNCMQACASPDDCREGYRCVNALGIAATGTPMMQDPTAGLLGPNSCQPLPATTPLEGGTAGEPCEADADCGPGRCLKSEGTMMYSGGYCTGSCLKDADCGDNGSCALPLLGGGAGTCYRSCQSNGDSDCREGYRCRSNASRRQCLPGAAPLGDDVAGSVCSSDDDCGGVANSCVTTLGGMPAPDGYCTQTCSDNTDCGANGTCIGGLGAAFSGLLGASAMGTCYRACTDATSCREGYICGQPPAPMMAGGIPGAGALGGMASSNACVVGSTPSEADNDAGVPTP